MRIKSAALVASILAATAGQAMAYEAGDVVLRAGIATVSPDVTDNVAGGAFQLDVNDDTQLGLTGTYFFTPTVGIQLLAATPFTHEITALNGAAVIGETKHLPPTVTVQWYPSISEKIHPYIGGGINYTTFWDSELNATGKTATGASKLSLTSSVGLALEAGIDIDISSNLVLNASIWKIDLNTDVKLDGVKAGELEIDPLAYMIGVGYKF